MKLNCWEYNKCGREPGGINVYVDGICPASVEEKADGINSGKNGGRSCWVLAGTLCNDEVQGSLADKIGNCIKCPFYQLVQQEEGVRFIPAIEIHEIILDNTNNSPEICLNDFPQDQKKS